MTTCRKFQSGAYVDKFGHQEETLCQSFSHMKTGSTFNIKRPCFTAGTNINKMIEAQDIGKINVRAGVGNKLMERTNFEASPIRPRIAGDFDKLQALDIETQGTKIQLSDKTIEELFKTKVPDPQDTQWLAEKARLVGVYQASGMTAGQIDRELETNKPLGREQRKISSKQNIGQSALTTADKLRELEQEVKDGRAESRAQQAVITAQFALVLADTNAISALTQQQLTDLGSSLARVGVPTTHKRLGLIPRFVDSDYYRRNAGMVNLLLFSRVRETPNTNQYNYDKIVLNFNTVPPGNPITGLPAVKLSTMVSSLSDNSNRRYLDLHRGGMINQAQMRAEVSQIQGGFNSPDVDIQPQFR